MSHLLVAYCDAARRVLRSGRRTLMDCSHAEAFPVEVRERFSGLYRRTLDPEIKVMVTGPLKAGKSTLLNVVAGNPHISQISQLPAYPCFVEVRDVERLSDGSPAAEPSSMFHRRDESTLGEMGHAEGIRFLDQLLQDYLADGKDAVIEYEKVVQRVDLPASESGLDLVLIDSPGLFFSRKVDETFFPQAFEEHEEDAEGVEDRTRQWYLRADVVIFVIRPEQVFFEAVAEHLGELARRTTMRVFLLVNASTRSKTQRGHQVIDFDQVEGQEQIREYFLGHVADPKLRDEIDRGDRISLHFADLLDAATAFFTPEGDAEAFLNGQSGQVVREIRGYLFGEDLARLKIEDLSRSIDRLFIDATEGLALLEESEEGQLQRLRDQMADAEEELAQAEDRLVILERRRSGLIRETQMLENRLFAIRHFPEFQLQERPPEGADPVLSEFFSLADLQELPADVAERLDEEVVCSARRIVDQIYRGWRSSEYGERSLGSLAEALWDSKLEGDQSLRSYHQEAVATCFREVARQIGASLENSELREALAGIESDRVEVQSSNPITGGSLPLLDFPPTWSLRWDAWKTGFRLSPKVLWGPEGKRHIPSGEEERVLYNHRKPLLKQIWGKPWDLGRCFSSPHLQAAARRLLMSKLSRVWQVRLEAERSASQRRLEKLVHRSEETRSEFEERSLVRDQIAEKLDALDETINDLAERRMRLEDLREELQNAVASGQFVDSPHSA